MTFPLPHDLMHFADALATVHASSRADLAAEIIAEAGRRADAQNAMRAREGLKLIAWGNCLHDVALYCKHSYLAANPGKTAVAQINDRDGIQAFEVALDALTDMVRAAEVERAA